MLIVEDEKAIADTLVFSLSAEHFQPTWVSSGQAAIEHCQGNQVDCVLLDVGLPDINGFDVLKQLRQFTDVPILFLTARSEEIDRILGLEMGADDYITKPFSPREVVTRVKVVLRRATPITKPISQPIEASVQQSSPFSIDEEQAMISLTDSPLHLTRAEYLLLKTLLTQPKRVFSRAILITAVWDENHPSDERAIDTHIKSLRAKLRAVDSSTDYIHTHRGLGYSLNV
ncbi:MAG: two-component system response regulator CreB [Gammaproteobacteria bacterium]|nr:MAG: two-component system response regulator CreB [Gammaproteobacteria bacterium]